MRFLVPNGKIHNKYNHYLLWSSLSNFVVSIEVVLSTHSMLNAFGNESVHNNLTLNYIGKDVIGQMGGLFIMNKISKQIDKNPNNFIKYSLLLQQFGTILENITPLVPTSPIIFLGALSNICKNISFMGTGGINAKVINKLSIDKDNIGELYSKLAIINTLSTSIGMSIGIGLTILIPCHSTRLFLLPVLGLIRYYSFMKSIDGII